MMNDFFVWNIDPILVDLGIIQLRYYSLLYAIGVAIYIFMITKSFTKGGFPDKYTDRFLVQVFIAMILGARLGHVLFYSPGYYLQNPLEIIMIWKGGLASHGAAIAMILAMYFYQRSYPMTRLSWLMDISAIPILFTGALIRLGNFFNSEIVGLPTQVSWAIIFERVDKIPRHPVQLYESTAYAVFGIVAVFLSKKSAFMNRPFFFTGYFFTAVFGIRFFLENFKSHQSSYDDFLGITTGQWLSLPFIFSGVLLLLYSSKQELFEVKYQEPQKSETPNPKKKKNRKK